MGRKGRRAQLPLLLSYPPTRLHPPSLEPAQSLTVVRSYLSVHLALAFDQCLTQHPDVSLFQSPADIVERLLPYHVFQVPNEDLLPPSLKSKGKGRARDWDADSLAVAVAGLKETEEEERARELPRSPRLRSHPETMRADDSLRAM